MGKSSPSPPAPPDPRVVGEAQTSSNVNTAVANSIMGNANEISPTGNVNYTQIGQQTITGPNGETYQIPQYQREQTLSPEQRQLYDQQTALGSSMNQLASSQVGRLNSVLGAPISSAGLPANYAMPTNPTTRGLSDGPEAMSVNLARTFADTGKQQTGFADVGGPQRSVGANDFSADRRRVEDALYSRLNPQLQFDRDALESKLINQGFVRDTAAFNQSMDEYNRQANDARNQVVLAGGQEQSRLFGMDMSKGQFANAGQQQAYDQAIGRGMFGNNAQAQNFSQAAQSGEFANNAQMQQATFNSNQQQQEYENAARQTQYGNDLQQQGFGNSMAIRQAGATDRERALQEMLSLRNQPIAEISSLMHGGAPTLPNFAQYQGGTVDTTPIGSYMYQTAGIQQENFQAEQARKNATTNALIGGIAGLGGAGLYGLGKKFG